MSESYYPEWDNEPGDYFPGDDEDLPAVPSFTYADDHLYDQLTEDNEEWEPFALIEGKTYFLALNGEAICPECGDARSTELIADHMASEHSDDEEDWPSTPEDWRHGEPAGDEGWS